MQTLPLHSGTGCTGDCGLVHTWSLVAEVTFYAVLPLYVLLAARVARGRSVRGWMRAELLLLAALSAISLALRFLLVDQGSPWVDGTLIGYVFWFALGIGLAVASVELEGSERQPAPRNAGVLDRVRGGELLPAGAPDPSLQVPAAA